MSNNPLTYRIDDDTLWLENETVSSYLITTELYAPNVEQCNQMIAVMHDIALRYSMRRDGVFVKRAERVSDISARIIITYPKYLKQDMRSLYSAAFIVRKGHAAKLAK